MKSHPHLLVRDALAELFVDAAAGNPEANARLEALVRWAKEGSVCALLLDLRAAEGTPLFLPGGGLDSPFAPLEGYVRDRARRFEAARGWIRDQRAESDPLERARAAWDAGLFFEAHEILEAVWLANRSPERGALQALLMAAAALHHLCDGNRAGAIGLCREAARRLRLSPASFPVEVDALAQGLDELRARIEAAATTGGLEEIGEIPPFRRRTPAA